MSRRALVGGAVVVALGVVGYAFFGRPAKPAPPPPLAAAAVEAETLHPASPVPTLPATAGRPAELPPDVPTRDEVGMTQPGARPPSLDKPRERPTDAVRLELDETRQKLSAAAQSCLTAAGQAKVKVDVVYREGDVLVRHVQVEGSTLGATVDACIQTTVAKQTWPTVSDDKIFSLTFPVLKK